MKKLFASTLLIIQLMTIQGNVLCAELSKDNIETRIEYASGWTGPGVASDIKAKINQLEKKTKKENKILNIRDVKISPEWGYAFIIYELIDKSYESKLIYTDVQYASGWTGSSLANDINANLDLLQRDAETWSKVLNIKHIKIKPEWGYAFIIYELTAKTIETSSVSTHVQYASGWTGSGIADDIQAKIHLLESEAEKENKILTIKDVKITPEWGYAFIIYELSDQS